MMSWAHDLELLILETFKCLFVMILLEVKSNTQEIAHNSDGGLRFGVFSGQQGAVCVTFLADY